MHWDERIGARLKLRDLHILLAVVQAGSMAKAATRLAISQPAVSKAISDIEHVLQVSLLDRSPRGVEVTQFGRALIRRSTAVFDELRQGVAEIGFLADPTTGELRIGTGEAMAGVVVAQVIDRLSRRYPRIVFHVVPGERANVLDALQDRNVEFIVTRLHDSAADEHIEAEVLHDDTFVVVAGARNRLAQLRKIKLAELVDEPWTLPPLDTWSGALIQKAFCEKQLELPRATVFSFSQQLRINLAGGGRFLTVLPDYLMRSAARHTSVRALPIELPATRRRIGILRLKNRGLSPVAKLFIDCARVIGQEIVTGSSSS